MDTLKKDNEDAELTQEYENGVLLEEDQESTSEIGNGMLHEIGEKSPSVSKNTVLREEKIQYEYVVHHEERPNNVSDIENIFNKEEQLDISSENENIEHCEEEKNSSTEIENVSNNEEQQNISSENENVTQQDNVVKIPDLEILEFHEAEEKSLCENEEVAHLVIEENSSVPESLEHHEQAEKILMHEDLDLSEDEEKNTCENEELPHPKVEEKSPPHESSELTEIVEEIPNENENAVNHTEEDEEKKEVSPVHEIGDKIYELEDSELNETSEESPVHENLELLEKSSEHEVSELKKTSEKSTSENEDTVHTEEEEKSPEYEILEKEEAPCEIENSVDRDDEEEEEESPEYERLEPNETKEKNMIETADPANKEVDEKIPKYESLELHEEEEKIPYESEDVTIHEKEEKSSFENELVPYSEEKEISPECQNLDLHEKQDSSPTKNEDTAPQVEEEKNTCTNENEAVPHEEEKIFCKSEDMEVQEEQEKRLWQTEAMEFEEEEQKIPCQIEPMEVQEDEEKSPGLVINEEEDKCPSDDDVPEYFYGFESADLDPVICGRSVLRRLVAQAEYRLQQFSPQRPILKMTFKKEGESLVSSFDNYGYNNYDSGADSITEENFIANEFYQNKQSIKGSNQGLKFAKADIMNPAYLEPFNYGWKREMVYRASTPDNQTVRMADIYYYTPSGKKVRSSREIAKYLGATNLTLDNFTFFKESLNVNDPEKEIIREAKIPSVGKVSLVGNKKASKKRTKVSPIKLKPQVKNNTPLPPPYLITTEAEIHAPPASANINQNYSAKKPIKINVQDPCSIRCLASVGSVPSLQCKDCLCLYHPECTDYNGEANFVCKNCRTDTDKSLSNIIKPSTSSWDNLTSETLTKPRSPVNENPAPLPIQTIAVIKGRRCIVVPQGNIEAIQEMLAARSNANVTIDPSRNVDDEDDDDDDDAPEDFFEFQKMAYMRNRRKFLIEQRNRLYFMNSTCAGYNALIQIFQYLPLPDLLRVTQVCRMWKNLVENPSLWEKVIVKNSRITNWDDFAEALRTRETKHLDLKDMIVDDDADEVWDKLVSVLPKMTSLVRLELKECPSSVVEEVMKNCPRLEILKVSSIKCDTISLESASNLTSCRELSLKTISGISLIDDLTPLMKLTELTHLTLTSVNELGTKHVEVLQFLEKLESLELGECIEFPEKFGTTVLSELKNLKHLRLEKGQGSDCTFDILDSISKLDNLTQLELINFDVKSGFDEHLGNCKNLRKLLVIPTYVSQAGTTNNMLIGGAIRLSDSLTHFAWGVTKELLKTTELFADQYNKKTEQITEDSIPVLKPVPYFKLIEDVITDKSNEEEQDGDKSNSPQVEIMPLSYLEKLLLYAMPKTQVKILKIPFVAAAKQNLSSCMS